MRQYSRKFYQPYEKLFFIFNSIWKTTDRVCSFLSKKSHHETYSISSKMFIATFNGDCHVQSLLHLTHDVRTFRTEQSHQNNTKYQSSHKYQSPLLNRWHFPLQWNLSGSKLYCLSPMGDLFLVRLNMWPVFDSDSPTKGLTSLMCSTILTGSIPKSYHLMSTNVPYKAFPLKRTGRMDFVQTPKDICH